jgi:hypothetical protein
MAHPWNMPTDNAVAVRVGGGEYWGIEQMPSGQMTMLLAFVLVFE